MSLAFWRFLAKLSSTFFLLTVLCGTGVAQTYVNRVWHYPQGQDPYYTIENITLSSLTVWNAGGSPYILEAHVTVAQGVQLSAPGATVQVVEGMGIYVEGVLSATDTTFTRAGTGFWRGIYLSSNSSASSLRNCQIRYAGGVGYCYYGCSGLGNYHGESRFTSLYMDGCSPLVTGCLIEESWSNGIEIWRGQPTIESTHIRNLGADSYSMVYDITDTYPMLAGNIASGTGHHGISVPGGRWVSSGTWGKPGAGFPYLLRSSLTLGGGATLHLDPGVEIRSEGAIGFYVLGTLLAGGTPGDPIVFGSRKMAPQAGDWSGIYFGPGAGSSSLSNCQIEKAGGLGVCYYGCHGLGSYHGADRFAAIYVDGSAPLIADCLVNDSFTNGIETYGAAPVLTNCTIQSCRNSGLRMEAGSHPQIDNTLFQSTGTEWFYAVTQDASSTAEPNNVSFNSNKMEGVEVRGGHMVQPTVWRSWAPNAPYAITGGLRVEDSALLAIDPGVVIKTGGPTVGLFFDGPLFALGGPDPVTFTSLTDDSIAGDTNGDMTATYARPGDWQGMYLGPGATDSVLDQCAIRYSGSYGSCYYGCHGLGNIHGADRFASLYIDSASASVSGCTLENSWGNGIEIWQGRPSLLGNRFHNMGADSYPLVLDITDTYPIMSGNITSGTGQNAISMAGGVQHLSGTLEKPGDNFPYFLQSNLTIAPGTILTVSPGVTFHIPYHAGFYAEGTLNAEGTPLDPVVFTTRSPGDPYGFWAGIYLGPGSGNSVLRFCSILYGASFNSWNGLGDYHGATRWTSLYLDSCAPQFDCCTIANSRGNAIEMFASGGEITNTVIHHCAGNGISMEGGSTPQIVNNTIVQNNAGSSSGISCLDSTPVIGNNVVAFNTVGMTKSGSGAPALTKNCVYGNGADYVGLSAGATDYNLNPQLVGSEVGDCHLSAGSPCLETGNDSLLPSGAKDRDGETRRFGIHLDIGAYEYGSRWPQVFGLSGDWDNEDLYGLFNLNQDERVDFADLILLLERWR